MRSTKSRAIRINLALQGGGAHGAFTWGVLHRLIEDERVEIDTISATSAGAVNAVALLSGLAEGGRQGAMAKLAAVWEAVNRAGVPQFLRFYPLLAGLARMNGFSGQGLGAFSGFLSPYDVNPLDLNPLRNLLAEHIDFERLRAEPPARLRIAATEVATGRARLFSERELTVDVVLASACLPTLHRAIEIEGVHYWDGGFSANPDVLNLVRGSATGDTLIVLLNPGLAATMPKNARDISGQINRITFNQPFLRDIQQIEAVRSLGTGPVSWLAPAEVRRIRRHRFHVIAAERYTAELSPDSKLRPDWELLTYLHDMGRKDTGDWLDQAGPSVGRRGTIDLAARFLRDDSGASDVANGTSKTMS